ncbi:MAG TPA: ribonuclease HI family protein [Candidatus Kaiserbacteria bacterium]|nr:ribonuclease HI family protein [Candidatus Kaiserbacteria bacterium]
MNYIINTDGGSRGNPGNAGAGAVIRDDTENTVATVSKFLGHRTNNFAEYEAIILALKELAKLVPENKLMQTKVLVKMDSELVVKQMQGVYRVKHPVLQLQKANLKKLVAMFEEVSFTHIPRAQNKDADLLANEAMDRGE